MSFSMNMYVLAHFRIRVALETECITLIDKIQVFISRSMASPLSVYYSRVTLTIFNGRTLAMVRSVDLCLKCIIDAKSYYHIYVTTFFMSEDNIIKDLLI